MSIRLPRKLDTSRAVDLADLGRRTFTFSSDVYDALKAASDDILTLQTSLASAGITTVGLTYGSPTALTVGGSSADGTDTDVARADHRHAISTPKLDDLATPDDNTDLNATVSYHGLLRKLDGTTTNYLRGDGTWAAPATGVAIGDTVTSGTAGSVLYLGAAGVLAQDNASFFYDYSNGRLGLGTATPGFPLTVATNSATQPITTYRAVADAGSSHLRMYGSRGTVASPTATTSDDVLGGVVANGYHSGGAYGVGAGAITFRAAESFTSTAQGVHIDLVTTPIASSSASRAARLSAPGNLLVFGTGAVSIPADPTSAKGVLMLTNNTAPTASVADSAILYAADDGAGNSKIYVRNEAATSGAIVTKQDQAFTSGRVPYATTEDRLTDSANLRYDSSNIRLSVGAGNNLGPLNVYSSGTPLPWIVLEDGDQTGVDWSGVGFNVTPSTRTAAIFGTPSSGGGGSLYGFSTGNASVGAVVVGHVGGTAPSVPGVRISGCKHNGTTGRTAMAAAEPVADFWTNATKLSELFGGAQWALYNGTAPSASVTDGALIYAADDGAGNSKLYVRNEAATAGAIVTKQSAAFTSGRVPYATTEDRLTDSSYFQYNPTDARLAVGHTGLSAGTYTASGISNTVGVYNYRSNGTLASPTATAGNDNIGAFWGGGHSGSGWVGTVAGMVITASQAWTATNRGAYIYFQTQNNSGGGARYPLTLGQAGEVTVNDGNFSVARTVAGTASGVPTVQVAGYDDPFSSIKYGNNTSNAFVIAKSRGTSGSRTAVSSGDTLAGIYGVGTTSASNWSVRSVGIECVASENFSTTAWGSELRLRTTDLASTTPVTGAILSPRGNLAVMGSETTFTDPTSARGSLALMNGVIPSASVTNGVLLYAEDVAASSELKVRDEASNITTLSPHNFELIPGGPSEALAWGYYSERDGQAINCDITAVIRAVEKLTGEQFIYTGAVKTDTVRAQEGVVKRAAFEALIDDPVLKATEMAAMQRMVEEQADRQAKIEAMKARDQESVVAEPVADEPVRTPR